MGACIGAGGRTQASHSRRRPCRKEPQCVRAQTFKKLIGEGSIGRVHLGRWQETDVAIKVLTSLNNIAVGMATGSPTPRASGASARNDVGDSYDDDVLATKRTLEREARARISSRIGCLQVPSALFLCSFARLTGRQESWCLVEPR